jgi:hypothetical protein
LLSQVYNCPATPASYNGIFEGIYRCGSTESRVQFSLTANSSGELSGTVDFGGTPSVPLGKYSVKGKWDGNAFTLNSERWIKQPKGYSMISFTGHLKSSQLQGVVLADICSNFSAKRV